MNDALFRRSTEVDVSTVGERVILFERATKRAIVLNPTGAQMWQLLETPRSATQLGAALGAQFPDVNAARIAADVEAYLSEMLDQKLIAAA